MTACVQREGVFALSPCAIMPFASLRPMNRPKTKMPSVLTTQVVIILKMAAVIVLMSNMSGRKICNSELECQPLIRFVLTTHSGCIGSRCGMCHRDRRSTGVVFSLSFISLSFMKWFVAAGLNLRHNYFFVEIARL